ncbi:MAG: cobalamin biosynthesis protein CbiA [FCB group bacterium]|nr:cobalamin biosynthesis protein CbiA [FCB group bacterium]
MMEKAEIRYPTFPQKIIILVGGFGSGKTEVSVNLAKFLVSDKETPLTIVDLDLVNPYFRTREAILEMEALGIRVVAPQGGQTYADLPILLPEVKGAIEHPQGRLILDVGGDSQGAKSLGSLAAVLDGAGGYEMLAVLNSRRPQTADAAGCRQTMARIEATSKLRFTGLVANSHMIDETDMAVVVEGYELACQISKETGLPLAFVSVRNSLLEQIESDGFDCPILPLSRSMLKPWERKENQAEK